MKRLSQFCGSLFVVCVIIWFGLIFGFYLGRRFKFSCKLKNGVRRSRIIERTPYKSFGQAFSKACGNPKGKARGRSRRSEIPKHILTNQAKLTVKPSKTNKPQKRNAAQKCWYARCNVSYNLSKTVNLHCAYSILIKQK